jgi:hypothetical protein
LALSLPGASQNREQAAQRGMAVRRLVKLVLTLFARDNLFDAVIDTDDR